MKKDKLQPLQDTVIINHNMKLNMEKLTLQNKEESTKINHSDNH